MSPLNAYLLLELGINIQFEELQINWKDPIGQDYLKLHLPLLTHENCHIFSKHSDHSKMTADNILQIALGNCSSFCKRKSFQLLGKRSFSSTQLVHLETFASQFLSFSSPLSVPSWMDSAIECFFVHLPVDSLKPFFLHFANPDFPTDIRICIAKCTFQLLHLEESSLLALVLLLQDDDAEVRSIASLTTSRLLSFASNKCEAFCLEALLHHGKLTNSLAMLHQHYKELLTMANNNSSTQDTLFEHEESNLFRQLPLELSILHSFSPNNAKNQHLTSPSTKHQHLLHHLQQLVHYSLW